MPAIHLSRDTAFAGRGADFRYLRKRNAGAARQSDGQAADGVGTRADGFREPDGDVVNSIPDEQRRYRLSADTGLNNDGDIRNVDSESSGGFPVHPYLNLGKRRLLVDGDIGRPRGVTSEALERIRRAWQNQGYFQVEASGEEKILTSGPAAQRISINVHVEAGQQYRLEEIRFNNNREVSNAKALRPLFPLKDGDVFDGAAMAKGVDQLRFAYRQLGHLNFTSIPNTQFNEDRQTISLVVDIDEGKKFYVSSLKVLGGGDSLLNDSLIKRGDVYDERLVDLFIQEHAPSSVDASLDSRIHLQLDESAGTVAITFDLRDCPFEEQP